MKKYPHQHNLHFLHSIRQKDDWKTPDYLYDKLNKCFKFTMDLCPINPQYDGLSISWHGNVFCNPPYSEVGRWIEKGYTEILRGNVNCLVFLVYAKTDTRWFHKYIWKNDKIKWRLDFIKGRVKFGDGKHPAPFPSMLVIYED